MALEALFAPHEEGIGAAARQEDIMAALQKCPGVLQVRRMELRGLDQNSYQTASETCRSRRTPSRAWSGWRSNCSRP